MKFIDKLFCLLLLAGLFASCVKKDEFKKYTSNGEIVYPGLADSVIVSSGHNRAQLAVVLGNDPLVTKIRVYWKNRQDSVDVNVGAVTAKDTVKILIPNLAEGNYNFLVYTYDAKGNRSVSTTAVGQVYGDTYLGSLNTRPLKTLEPSDDGKTVLLKWGSPSTGELATEISYVGTDGTSKKVQMPADTAIIALQNFKYDSKISYRSVFKPDSLSIDTYYSPAEIADLPVFERLVDKAGFKALSLPTDINEGGYGWLMEFLWDDNYNPPGFATESVLPCWFTFDMGQKVSLSRLKYWQPADRMYVQQSVKTFEVWGSNSPAADGSWASWTKLTTCNSIKPSGLPAGQMGPDDAAYALAGENFQLPAGLPKFRFIRIKALQVWGDGEFAAFEEFNFYTHDQ